MGFKPRLVLYNIRLVAKIRHFGEATMPKRNGAHASTLHIMYCITSDSWRKSGSLVKPLCLRGVGPMPRLCILCPAIGLTTAGKNTEKPSVRVVEKCHLGCCMHNGPKFVHIVVFSRNRKLHGKSNIKHYQSGFESQKAFQPN